VAWCRYQLMLVMALPSLAVESCWRWRWCCWVLLVMALPRQHWPSRDVIAESCWRWCYRVLLPMALPSLTGNGITEATLSVAWCCYRVLLVMALPRQCWSWCDIAIESCWWWRCQGDIGHGMMSLSSLASDATAEVTLVVVSCCYQVMLVMALSSRCWLWRDVATESCWRWHGQGDIGHSVADDHANATPGLICI
jgi:hypothetical protein